MENYIYQTSNGELCHWGVKGMRWGVRRYQNKDGSLTAAGKKRVADEKNELKEREREIKRREKAKIERAKLDAKKAELDERERAINGIKQKTKTAREMTDDELRDQTARLTLESNYKTALRNNADPVQVSKGKKFVATFSDKFLEALADRTGNAAADLAAQTVKSIGAKYINQMLEKNFEGIEKVHTNNKK